MVHVALPREQFLGLPDQVWVRTGLQQLNAFDPIVSQEVAAHGAYGGVPLHEDGRSDCIPRRANAARM
jgi:hypothetical protein